MSRPVFLFSTNLRLIIFCAVLVFSSVISSVDPVAEEREHVNMRINNREYTLLTARTAEEKIKGLSGITELTDSDGMVFYYDPPQKVTVWNKGTLLDLDIIWIYQGKVVGREFLPRENSAGLVIKESPRDVDQMIEIVRKPR